MAEFNKLVRDKIPEIAEQSGAVAVTRTASDDEYKHLLNEKLKEEVNEFLESGEIEEMADILEVLYAIAKNKGSDMGKVEFIREKKFIERGGFSRKIVLDKVLDNYK